MIPNGELKIKNMLGKKIQQINLNTEQQKVLPGGIWKHDHFIENLSWKDAGRLQANIHITYGLSQKSINDSITFWYIPMWLVVVLAALLIVVISFIILLARKKGK